MTRFLSEDGLRYFYNQIKSKFAAASHNHSAGNITSGTLPIVRGGTGADNVAEAVKTLLGSASIGSSTKPLYYDGEALKACADSIGGGGIVDALLEENGYAKFANGLILQWGYESVASNTSHPVDISFNVAFPNSVWFLLTTIKCKKTGGTTFFYCLPSDVENTSAKLYFSGYGSGNNNTAGYYWVALGI